MVPLRSYSVFIFIVCCSMTAVKNEYCYMDDPNPYPYFGTKTAYEAVRAKKMFVPSDCTPQYMWALMRHGTRYAVGRQWNLQKMIELKNQIISNHETHRRGTLCAKDIDVLKNWDGSPFPKTMDGDLAPQGKNDALNLAKRLKTTFPNFLTATREKYDLKTSTAPRAQATGIAFTNEFFQTSHSTVEGNMITLDDEFLRIHDKINFTETFKPVNAFIESKYVQQLINNVSLRLGFEKSLTYDEVNRMYLTCGYEIAWTLKNKSAFCVAFTPDHLKILEYLEDLAIYNRLGYGFPIIRNFYCPVVKDLVLKLTDAAADAKMLKSGSLYFTHSETVAPAVTKLGLFHDDVSLSLENYEILKENRKWRTSLFDPFMSNLIVVLYKCSSEFKVAFYNNENIIQFPGCKQTLCPLEAIKRDLNDKLTPEKCEIDPQYLWRAETLNSVKPTAAPSDANKLQHRFWLLIFVNFFIAYILIFFQALMPLVWRLF